MSEYDSYLTLSLYLDICSQEYPKMCFRASDTGIQHFLVLVSRGLHFVAVNMHYAKFTLWTPKLQILT